MSKRGFYEILKYLKEHENLHYNDILRYSLENKIVGGRASITIILNGLTDLGLLHRTVSQERPIRTTYKVTENGTRVIKNFKQLEIVLSSTTK